MRFADCLLVVFACVLVMSIGCKSSDDVINTPPVADGACSNPPGVNNRFVDCGNGTVTDTQTGLIWLKNANCFFSQDWDAAMAFAAGLKSGDCGLTDNSAAGNWRLPTLSCAFSPCQPIETASGEFASIFNSGVCGTAPYALNANGTACSTVAPASPFTGVLQGNYWSSTPYANSPNYAWSVTLNGGYVFIADKSSAHSSWPVRGGP